MSFTITDVAPLRKRLSLTIPAADVAARRKKILGELAPQVDLKGFRPGHVPKALVEKRFGEQATQETQERLLHESIQSAMKEAKVKPIGGWDREKLETTNGIEAAFVFDIVPEITLPDPASLGVKKEEVEIADAKIEETIMTMRRRVGRLELLDGQVELKEDDALTLVGTIHVDGECIKELNGLHTTLGAYPLLGTPGEEVLKIFAGVKVGGSVKFDTKVPAAIAEGKYEGKTGTVAVTVQEARRLQPAELNAEFLNMYGLSDESLLREAVKKMLSEGGRREIIERQIKEVQEKTLAATKFDLPETLLKNLVADELRRREAANAQGQKLDLDVATISSEVERDLRLSLIAGTIADKHNVRVENQDVQQQVRMAAQQTGKDPKEIIKHLKKPGVGDEVMSEIIFFKAWGEFRMLATGETK